MTKQDEDICFVNYWDLLNHTTIQKDRGFMDHMPPILRQINNPGGTSLVCRIFVIGRQWCSGGEMRYRVCFLGHMSEKFGCHLAGVCDK